MTEFYTKQAVEEFQKATQDGNWQIAYAYLKAHNWNVQEAVKDYESYFD